MHYHFPNRPYSLKPHRAAGFTLIEMIVMMTIVLMVTTIGLRVAIPDADSRRMREAARQVDAFIHGARARAIETGRPFGVQIVPDRDVNGKTTGGASRLVYVQVPETYAGDTFDSRAEILSGSSIRVTDIGWQGIVNAGDLVQLNHVGHVYRISSTPTASSWSLVSTDPSFGGIPYDTGLRVPYKVIRQPIKAGGELELPETVVIDTNCSGLDNLSAAAPTPPDPHENITFLFSPSGRLTSANVAGNSFNPGSCLYLNIGRNENIGAGGETNLTDLGTFWVSVNGQTGLVTTAENAGGGSVLEARRFVRDKLAITK